jgi:protease YdgD
VIARRRRWPPRLVTLLCALTTFATAASAMAEPADRDAWPWAAVGRVERNGGGPCSGVLVAARTVLTVGHCVARRGPWRAEAPERLAVRFGEQAYAVVAVRVAATSPYAPDGGIGPIRHDWAVLELAVAPAVEPVAYEGPSAARRAFVADAPLAKVGWVQGRREDDPDCRIRRLELDAAAFTFACDGGPGQGRSGSALLIRTTAGFAVVAVQSAEARTGIVTLGIAVSPEPAVLTR